jgi:hypothetical protein
MDLSLPGLVLLAAAAISWPAIVRRRARPLTTATKSFSEERVNLIAQAIAVAEGYYAAGTYDGRSLPYRLNNPGSLENPAMFASSHLTWKDTGLIEFPTSDMGWEALRKCATLADLGGGRAAGGTEGVATGLAVRAASVLRGVPSQR